MPTLHDVMTKDVEVIHPASTTHSQLASGRRTQLSEGRYPPIVAVRTNRTMIKSRTFMGASSSAADQPR